MPRSWVTKRLYFSEYEFVLQSRTQIVPKGLPSGQQIGYHVELYVGIGSPCLIKERIRDQQLAILGNNRFAIESRAPKVFMISRVIRIPLRSARDKNVYILPEDPHDQTCGHGEHVRHEIHNLLPPFQNWVWNRWFKVIAWRKQSLVPVGSYFFHRASILSAHFRPFIAFWEATLRPRKISRKAAKTQRSRRNK